MKFMLDIYMKLIKCLSYPYWNLFDVIYFCFNFEQLIMLSIVFLFFLYVNFMELSVRAFRLFDQ